MNYADIIFDEDGTPKSQQFDDVYFSQGKGVEETQHVFIEPNALKQRFQSLSANEHFTIAETGFGTGLNFFVAWEMFEKYAPKSARLNFVSCEKYPLSLEHLVRSHKNSKTYPAYVTQLAKQYPPPLSGFHFLEFERVSLTLILNDAVSAFSELTAKVDAWFLDGFTPKKNPDMWVPELFQQMERLSTVNTTVATFTSARVVRDGLQGAGFKLQKLSGFGLKREMIRGDFIGSCGPKTHQNWPSSELALPKKPLNKRVAIIGAGIAGTTTAVELVKRGFDVHLFEKSDAIATGGSGNSQGAIYAKLSAKPNASNQFYAQALILAQHILTSISDDVPHQQCGLVQLVHNEREQKRLADLSNNSFIPNALAVEKTAGQLSELLGVQVADSGLWFPEGGWVSPSDLVRFMANKFQLNIHTNTEITTLEETHNGWKLLSATDKSWDFDQVVVASAFDSKQFTQTQHLPLNAIAGQVTQLKATEQHKKLKAVICTDRYVMPTLNDTLTIGSTFRVKSTNTVITQQDHAENLKNLKNRVPGLLKDTETVESGRAAIRCTSPDYLPLVGPVCEPEKLKNQFRIPLQRNRTHKEPAAQPLPGLWINVAHGSKGLCSSHLCARLLANMMNGEPIPLQTSLVSALNPNRFVIRGLRREERQKL